MQIHDEPVSYDPQYWAGLFDGEGCLTIDQRNWAVKIQISNTYKPVLEKAKEIFGGTLNTVKPKNPNHRPVYVLVIIHNKAIRFLEIISPFVVIKRNQVKVAIEYWMHKETQNTRGRGYCLTTNQVSTRQMYKKWLQELKRE